MKGFWMKAPMGQHRGAEANQGRHEPLGNVELRGKTGSKQARRLGYLAALWLVLQGLLMPVPALGAAERKNMSYSELLQKIDAGEVYKVEIDPAQQVARVKLKEAGQT
jgi:cell division protease FtsH